MLHSADEIKTNARIKLIPDEGGEFKPYEILCFDKATFVPRGWEGHGGKKHSSEVEQLELAIDEESDSFENRRKSYCRARNKLFDILTCTLAFDCFVTLTLDAEQIDRYDYDEVIKKLNTWLGNRTRRSKRGAAEIPDLVYALVPERHKDGAVHFHGLMNLGALKTARAVNPHTGEEMTDNKGRPIFNMTDFPYGFTTVIPLSGDNARIATAKYCYKYITKSKGEKIGGRYYLSGGAIGRPKYQWVNVNYDEVEGDEQRLGDFATFKKVKL